MPSRHRGAPHDGATLGARLNVLRAGVLGAQDGIVSTAGLVVGVAGATTDAQSLLIAGVAGLIAGALSMAGGEYTSVSTQRDTERASLAREAWELRTMPESELDELAEMYESRGLPPELAREVAIALTEHDALAAHAETELGLDPAVRVDPWQAAATSAVSFALGAVLPLLAMVLAPASVRVGVTFVVVVIALVVTGFVSARQSGAHPAPAIARIVGVGVLAMVVTYAIGTLVGVAV
jgi:VIT1/CCC1 family predicted Fe2+/Mn2+ transporter